MLNNIPVNNFTFINRDKSLKEVIKNIEVEKHRFFSIWGEGGIGKTSFVIKLLNDLILNKKLVYHAIIWTSAKKENINFTSKLGLLFKSNEKNFKSAYRKKRMESMVDLYRSIAQILKYQDIDRLLKKNEKKQEEEILNLINSDVQKGSIILVIDDLDGWSDWSNIFNFIQLILPPNIVIITTRRELNSNDIKALTSISLRGLNDIHSMELLDSVLYNSDVNFQFEEEEKELILKYCKGNPLVIKLMMALCMQYKNKSKPDKDGLKKQISSIRDIITKYQKTRMEKIEDYLISNLYEYFSEDAKNILLVLSITNENKYSDLDDEQILILISKIIDLVPQKTSRILKELKASSIIDRDENNNTSFDMHPLISNFLSNKNPKLTEKYKSMIEEQIKELKK